MSTPASPHLSALTTPATTPAGTPTPRPSFRPMMIFAATALGVGGTLFTLSTLIQPDAPFILAGVLLGLALPALVLTYRETGSVGIRALLRDCVRLPRSRWWLPLAGLGLPVASWAVGAALGGAQPLTIGLAVSYAVDLVTGVLIINLWEEMAWTGYFQRRAVTRWGVAGGSLVAAAFFTGIHVPLTLGAAHSVREGATNLLFLAGVAIGIRLLIAKVDVWSGRSLLVVGVLHSAFNATEALLQPAYFWVRLVVTVAAGIGAVAFTAKAPSSGPRTTT